MVRKVDIAKAKKLANETVRISKNVYFRGRSVETTIMPNPDPVLRYLSQSDEREFRTMTRNNTAISIPKRNVESIVLEKGHSIQIGRGSKKSKKGAKVLKEFVESALSSVYKFNVVKKKALDCILWGWRPFEVIWRFDYKHKGKTYWAPHKMIEKDPELFQFTIDRDLVYRDENHKLNLYDVDDTDREKFFILTYDSINNPYGQARLSDVWLLDHAKQRFLELFSVGMQRSMGLLRAREVPSAPGATLQKASESIESELQDIIEFLNVHNIILNKAGWALDIISDIHFADGWIKAMEYIDRHITSGISMGSLSFDQGDFSSRGQSSVHVESSKRDAMVCCLQVDDCFSEFIRVICDLNIQDIDEEDYPTFVSNIRNDVDVKVVEAIARMGAPVDLDEIAGHYRIKLADENTKHRSKDPGMKAGRPEEAKFGAEEKRTKDDEENRSERDRSDEN